MPNNQRKKMRVNFIMGMNFSLFDDSEEEEMPELIEYDNDNEDFIDEKSIKRNKRTTSNGRKSKKIIKGGKKGTRRQVRFSNAF